jgi:hypothetical protein
MSVNKEDTRKILEKCMNKSENADRVAQLVTTMFILSPCDGGRILKVQYLTAHEVMYYCKVVYGSVHVCTHLSTNYVIILDSSLCL